MKSDLRNSFVTLLSIMFCLHLVYGGTAALAGFSYSSLGKVKTLAWLDAHRPASDASQQETELPAEKDDSGEESNKAPGESQEDSPSEDSPEDNEQKEVMDDLYVYPEVLHMYPPLMNVTEITSSTCQGNPKNRALDITIPPPKY